MNEIELARILEGCREHNQANQYELFALFYNYAMSIASTYAPTHEEAEEIVNDAFVKAFTRIETFGNKWTFKSWLRRIVINTAIDSYRARQVRPQTDDLDGFYDVGFEMNVIDTMSRDEILEKVLLLPPAYRMAFNLYVVEEFSHDEIALHLGISVGASKSNLFKARQQLKKLLQTSVNENR